MSEDPPSTGEQKPGSYQIQKPCPEAERNYLQQNQLRRVDMTRLGCHGQGKVRENVFFFFFFLTPVKRSGKYFFVSQGLQKDFLVGIRVM